STGRGLLLTCLWYIREVDPQTLLLTGLTRDGVYLVENGEVTAAVNNFRFNESPVGMLGRLLEVGATVPTLPREWGDYFNRAAMPPVRVEGFNMSSVSQASCLWRVEVTTGWHLGLPWNREDEPFGPAAPGAHGDTGAPVAVGRHRLPAAQVPADDGHPCGLLRNSRGAVRQSL